MNKSKELIKKTREYLDYIEEHISNVHLAFFTVRLECKDMRVIWDDYYYNLLLSDVESHDLSKFSPEEFTQYRQNFHPTSFEKPDKEVFDKAWDHHKEYNNHHWNTWNDQKGVTDPNVWEVHCMHMVIDWMAMGLKFDDTAQAFYEKNKHRIDLPDYKIDFIYEIFERIK